METKQQKVMKNNWQQIKAFVKICPLLVAPLFMRCDSGADKSKEDFAKEKIALSTALKEEADSIRIAVAKWNPELPDRLVYVGLAEEIAWLADKLAKAGYLEGYSRARFEELLQEATKLHEEAKKDSLTYGTLYYVYSHISDLKQRYETAWSSSGFGELR